LEESPLLGFEIDKLKVPDIKVTRILPQNRYPLLRNARHQRIERAGQLPARSRQCLRGGR
jgi:hypothetical protein